MNEICIKTEEYTLKFEGPVIEVNADIDDVQTKSNLVTSLSAASTDTQYPSAKCVYDIIGDVESLLSEV